MRGNKGNLLQEGGTTVLLSEFGGFFCLEFSRGTVCCTKSELVSVQFNVDTRISILRGLRRCEIGQGDHKNGSLLWEDCRTNKKDALITLKSVIPFKVFALVTTLNVLAVSCITIPVQPMREAFLHWRTGTDISIQDRKR